MADSILLIDDDEGVLRSIGAYFERLGAEVYREGSVKEGLDTFDRMRPDVVVLDLHLPDAEGLSALEALKAKNAAVVLLTGHGDIQTAVQAMQLGAENFLTKPVDMPHLAAAVARISEKVRLRRQNERLASGGGASPDGLDGLGVSSTMQELARQAQVWLLLGGFPERAPGGASAAPSAI